MQEMLISTALAKENKRGWTTLQEETFGPPLAQHPPPLKQKSVVVMV